MEENIYYIDAQNGIEKFFKDENIAVDPKFFSRFLNFFYSMVNYEEEGQKIRPQLLFTNNVDIMVKSIKSSWKFPVYSDADSTLYESRIKSLIPLCRQEWVIYIETRDGMINYGLCRAINSIKDENFTTSIFANNSLKEKTDKVFAIFVRPINSFCISLQGLNEHILNVNFALNVQKVYDWRKEITEFVDASFSKLRTTQKKLHDIKNMYRNIFTNVFHNIHGAICVVVDKDYKDNGLLEDGVWLKEPISINKLFAQTKSYSEEKLRAFADLFLGMLNYDGITVVDNSGKIRAYNVFVETNLKRTENIIGGARKRAAYTIINGKRKHVVGVYFQSHDGEMFYQEVKHPSKPIKATKKIASIENKNEIDSTSKETNKVETEKIEDNKIDE